MYFNLFFDEGGRGGGASHPRRNDGLKMWKRMIASPLQRERFVLLSEALCCTCS